MVLVFVVGYWHGLCSRGLATTNFDKRKDERMFVMRHGFELLSRVGVTSGIWARLLGFLLVMALFYVVGPRYWFAGVEDGVKSEEVVRVAVNEAARKEELRARICEIAAAVNESSENCDLMSSEAHPAAIFRLSFRRTREVLEGNPLVHSLTYGELPQLLDLVVFLEAFGSSLRLDEAQAQAMLDERGYSYEDVRFLLGFVHWYLSCGFEHWSEKEVVDVLRSRALLHGEHEREYVSERLKVFRGKDFGTFLGELD
jgi:hypothetical protein